MSTTDAISGANGLTDYLTQEVSVRMDMDDAAMHRGVAEIEAESVALMLLAAHNMDSSQYTRVRTTTLSILDNLTQTLPNRNPPGLDRAAARNLASATEPIPSPAHASLSTVEGLSL